MARQRKARGMNMAHSTPGPESFAMPLQTEADACMIALNNDGEEEP